MANIVPKPHPAKETRSGHPWPSLEEGAASCRLVGPPGPKAARTPPREGGVPPPPLNSPPGNRARAASCRPGPTVGSARGRGGPSAALTKTGGGVANTPPKAAAVRPSGPPGGNPRCPGPPGRVRKRMTDWDEASPPPIPQPPGGSTRLALRGQGHSQATSGRDKKLTILVSDKRSAASCGGRPGRANLTPRSLAALGLQLTGTKPKTQTLDGFGPPGR